MGIIKRIKTEENCVEMSAGKTRKTMRYRYLVDMSYYLDFEQWGGGAIFGATITPIAGKRGMPNLRVTKYSKNGHFPSEYAIQTVGVGDMTIEEAKDYAWNFRVAIDAMETIRDFFGNVPRMICDDPVDEE